MPAKAGIQQLQGPFWIPALRSAAAGMTSFVAGLVKNPGPEDLALVCPLEGGSPRLCSVQHTYGVMEYWKNKTQLRSSVTLIRGHWDPLMHRVHER